MLLWFSKCYQGFQSAVVLLRERQVHAAQNSALSMTLIISVKTTVRVELHL